MFDPSLVLSLTLINGYCNSTIVDLKKKTLPFDITKCHKVIVYSNFSTFKMLTKYVIFLVCNVVGMLFISKNNLKCSKILKSI